MVGPLQGLSRGTGPSERVRSVNERSSHHRVVSGQNCTMLNHRPTDRSHTRIPPGAVLELDAPDGSAGPCELFILQKWSFGAGAERLCASACGYGDTRGTEWSYPTYTMLNAWASDRLMWPRGRSGGVTKHPLVGPKTVFFREYLVRVTFRVQNVIQHGACGLCRPWVLCTITHCVDVTSVCMPDPITVPCSRESCKYLYAATGRVRCQSTSRRYNQVQSRHRGSTHIFSTSHCTQWRV